MSVSQPIVSWPNACWIKVFWPNAFQPNVSWTNVCWLNAYLPKVYRPKDTELCKQCDISVGKNVLLQHFIMNEQGPMLQNFFVRNLHIFVIS
jgi:hypothetical protein